jgi:hypothetical protein
MKIPTFNKVTLAFAIAAALTVSRMAVALPQNDAPASSPVSIQVGSGPSVIDLAMIAAVQKAVIRALDCDEGDAGSLMDAQDDFTPEAWKRFMNHMAGFIDDKGAPMFSQEFVPTGGAVLIGQQNGVTRLAFPGTLRQSTPLQDKNRGRTTTTYSAVIYVEVGGSPMKIQSLEQTTCASSAGPCPILSR